MFEGEIGLFPLSESYVYSFHPLPWSRQKLTMNHDRETKHAVLCGRDYCNRQRRCRKEAVTAKTQYLARVDGVAVSWLKCSESAISGYIHRAFAHATVCREAVRPPISPLETLVGHFWSYPSRSGRLRPVLSAKADRRPDVYAISSNRSGSCILWRSVANHAFTSGSVTWRSDHPR